MSHCNVSRVVLVNGRLCRSVPVPSRILWHHKEALRDRGRVVLMSETVGLVNIADVITVIIRM